MENKIISRIVRDCQESGYVVSTQLASFFAKSIIFNSEFKMKDLTKTSEKIGDLIRISTERLTQQDSPQLETIKMQVALRVAHKEFEKEYAQKEKTRKFKSRRISGDIIHKNNELEVFGDMVIYILHKTRMLEKSSEKIEQETMTALESVIPRDFVSSFMRQSESDKSTQLHELWKIVWGIKLFNSFSKGAYSEPSDEEKEKEDEKAKEVRREGQKEKIAIFQGKEIGFQRKNLRQGLDNVEECIENIVKYMENCSDDDPSLSRLRSELVNRRQFCSFLEEYYSELTFALSQINDFRAEFEGKVSKVQEIVSTYQTVEKSKIYPLFIDLTDLWKQSGTAYVAFKRVEYVLHFLMTYKKSYNFKIENVQIPPRSSDSLNMQFSEDIDESEYTKSKDPHQPFRIIAQMKKGEDERNKFSEDEMEVEFNGFDALSIVSSRRILRRADRNEVDSIVYNGKLYGFANAKNATIFFSDPEGTLQSLYKYLEIEPELIGLFGLENILPKRLLSVDLFETGQLLNSSCQTETHPVEKFKDPNYEWSEWKLRKRALKVADLRNKRTHSTQTNKSHFRRENDSQVFSLRNGATQTRKETGTNPKKHVRYIKNLRRKKKKMKVVNLEFDQ